MKPPPDFDDYYLDCMIFSIKGPYISDECENHRWDLITDKPKWLFYFNAGLTPEEAVRARFAVKH